MVEVVPELAGMDEPRRRLAGLISGLDIHYDLGEGHPLLGRRSPDLDLNTATVRSARSTCYTKHGRPVDLDSRASWTPAHGRTASR